MASSNAILLTIVILSFATLQVILAKEQCTISVKNGMHKERPPMVISVSDKEDAPEYIYAPTSHPVNLTFESGDEVTVYCPSKTNHKSTANLADGVLLMDDVALSPRKPMASLQCDNGDLKLDGEVVDFSKISCEEKARANYNAILNDTKNTCINGERYEIGYNLNDYGFLKIIDLCHNKNTAKTVWAHSVVKASNSVDSRYTTKNSNGFKSGSLYEGMQMSKDPYSLYKSYNNLVAILGKTKTADLYLSKSMSARKFFAKGHLIANKDMIFKSQQESTYFFANAVPMFQQVNANPGNWFFVEEYVRHMAFYNRSDLDVWVGGIGILKLENKEINLYRKSKKDQRIPVPKVLFKCAVSKKAGEAICFLVVNNPYLTGEEVEKAAKEYIVCDKLEICEKLNKDYNDGSRGYMYCCRLDDFYNNNKDEVGLEDVADYLDFDLLTLLTLGDNPVPIS